MLTLDNAHQLAAQRGGKCLSTAYVNNKTPLLWRCAEGHKWSARYYSIDRGTWCPKCAKRSSLYLVQREGLKKARTLAKSRGGECLSDTYQNNKVPMSWKCNKNHKWFARCSNISQGRWCPKCARQKHKKKTVVTLEKVRQLAAQKGGRCLSDVYKNNRTLLSWKCSEDHVWSTSYNTVNAGSWCPECAKTCRTKRLMQIRGLERACKLAVHKNGKCLSIAYQNNKTPLVWECNKGHRWSIAYKNVYMGSWCPKCGATQKHLMRIESLKKAHATAISRGGECLSTEYINNKSPLLWKCAKDHEWYATHQSVNRGGWCLECAKQENHCKKTVVTFEKVLQLAAQKNGECLSTSYKNSKAPLLWKCAENHKWYATYNSVYHKKTWCPKCVKALHRKHSSQMPGLRLLATDHNKMYPSKKTQSMQIWRPYI